MTYGISLLEKYGIEGLNGDEIYLLYHLTHDSCEHNSFKVFPIELEAHKHESSAMGFITPEAAEILDYDYKRSGLHDFIASILDDMENESEDFHYEYKGIDIYLSR